MPSTLTEDVYIQSFSCGADSCYLNLDLANIDGVQFSTFCNDEQYCRQYVAQYEKIAAKSQDEYPEYEIARKARVQMKLIDNEFSGQKIYNVEHITYLNN